MGTMSPVTTGTITGALANAAMGWAGRWSEPAVRGRVAECVLDHIACVCEGADSQQARYPKWIADCQFKGACATAVGGESLPAALAAYCNGQAANALDYDDTLVGHPGAAIIAAAVAAGESANASLDRVMAGICAGYDVHYVLTAAGWPSRARSGLVRGIGVWESVAAAVAVAIVWQLSEAQVVAAVNLAVVHAVPPYVAKWYERPVPSVKNNLGWAALGAIWAVEAVMEGSCGISNALDGPEGFFRIAGSDRWQWPPGIETGTPAVMKVAFKRFPACWHIQEYLRAVSAVVVGEEIEERATVRVDCAVPPSLMKFLDYRPTTPADVAFSLPCTIALVVVGARRGAYWSDPAVFESSAVRAIVAQSKYRRGRTGRIQVRVDGRATQPVRVPEPDYWNPAPWGLSSAEVRAKYEALVTARVGGEVARGAAECLTSASATGGLGPLVRVLRDRRLQVRGG